jgi:hypothetical protein
MFHTENKIGKYEVAGITTRRLLNAVSNCIGAKQRFEIYQHLCYVMEGVMRVT